jgi:YidC/Oxa1 family membrane protein insertase
MAKMKLLKPELDLIKEKNGDNMTQNQQDQMKLYQQAGVNPFSGCIPLLLQMPILFAMFYFFPVSIELRQKSFLWAEDLSTYDSIVNLPFTIPFYGSHVSLFVLLNDSVHY